MEAIPRSATGKLARRGLAERLGVAWGAGSATGRTMPADAAEARLAHMVAKLLETEAVDLDADLDEIGRSRVEKLTAWLGV